MDNTLTMDNNPQSSVKEDPAVREKAEAVADDTAKVVVNPEGQAPTIVIPPTENHQATQGDTKDPLAAGPGAQHESARISPTTAENTAGVDQSKQLTQKQASPAIKSGDNLSSSSDDSHDEPQDFLKNAKPPAEANQDLKQAENQPISNNQQAIQADNKEKVEDGPIQQNVPEVAKQEIPQQADAVMTNEEAVKKDPQNEAPAEKPAEAPAADPEGQKPAEVMQPPPAADPALDKKDDSSQPNNANVDNVPSGDGGNPEPSKPLEEPQGAQPAPNQVQEDVVMRDEAGEGPQEGNAALLAGNNEQQPINESQKPEGNDGTAPEVKKEAISKPINQSQLLWGQAAQGRVQHDQSRYYSDDEDQSIESDDDGIDPEIKRKCLDAQDPEKLFTLNINTYKVCQLNTILSAYGLKLEPKEHVLKLQKQKEKDERNRLIKQQKKEKIINSKIKPKRDQPNHGMMDLVRGSQISAAMYMNKIQSPQSNGQQQQKSLYEHMSQDQMGRPAAHADKEMKPSEAQVANGDKSAGGGEKVEQKEQMQSNVQNPGTGVTAGVKEQVPGAASPDPHIMNDMDIQAALSPTIRKSERDKTPIDSYVKIHNGIVRRLSSSDEDNNANMQDSSQANQLQGAANSQKHKKPQEQLHNAAKKYTVEDANRRITELFVKLSQHEHAGLMNQPLSKHCPMFDQYKHGWNSLAMIDMQYRCHKYNNSKEIISDINGMILTKYSYLSKTGESEDSMKVYDFQQYFDGIVKNQGLANLSLANKVESSKQKVQPKPKPTPKPKPVPSAKPQADNTKETLLDDPQTIIPCKQAVKPLTPEELTQLKQDIESLKEDQRQNIEKEVPECITTNAAGNKNIELNRLKTNPEIAAKLREYVKTQTKKNLQRERRRKIDVERRQKKKLLNNAKKNLTNTPHEFPADPAKPDVTGNATVNAMQRVPMQPGQDLLAMNMQAQQALQQAQPQNNPLQMQAFNVAAKTTGIMANPLHMTNLTAQQQQQYIQQMMMNNLMNSNGMNTNNFQQMLALFQMQQQQAGTAAAIPKQPAGAQGQVAGLQSQDTTAQVQATQKKGAAKPQPQDDGSSSSSESDSG